MISVFSLLLLMMMDVDIIDTKDLDISNKLEVILSGNIFCTVPCVADAYRKGLDEIHLNDDCKINDITPSELCNFVSSSDPDLHGLGRQIIRNLLSSAIGSNDLTAIDFIQKAMNEGLLELVINIMDKHATACECSLSEQNIADAIDICEILLQLTITESDYTNASTTAFKPSIFLLPTNVPSTLDGLRGYPAAACTFLRIYHDHDWKQDEESLRRLSMDLFVKLVNGVWALFNFSLDHSNINESLIRAKTAAYSYKPTVKALVNNLYASEACTR